MYIVVLQNDEYTGQHKSKKVNSPLYAIDFSMGFLCIGKNAKFKRVFDLVANALGQKPPNKKVHPLLMGITWRLSVFWAGITFSKPLITKSAANNAFSTTKYSNAKIKEAIAYEFYTLEETVENAVKGRLK